MGKDNFRHALSDFTFDAASGGAIRHLTDLGYTVRQIGERLDFPTPPARIQEAVWKRLVETGVILTEDPFSPPSENGSAGDNGMKRGVKVNYVREYDAYGRASFRRVEEKSAEGITGEAFLACEFGLLQYREPEKYKRILSALEAGQAEYIDGLPWPKKRVWHRADGRMLAIGRRLEEAGLARGACSLWSGEKELDSADSDSN